MNDRAAAIQFAGWFLCLVCVLMCCPCAWAWHDDGHVFISRLAVDHLPDELPAFFRDAEGRQTIAHVSVDPDVFRDKTMAQLVNEEPPEHYIDFEFVEDTPLPTTRYAYIALLQDKKLKPEVVGTLPYALTEWAQRLTMAFAEHRARPNDKAIHAKCLVYAGLLSHYAADLENPLHTTVHHDGRAKPDGSSPHTGIHGKTDALPGKLMRVPDEADRLKHAPLDIAPFDNLWQGVLDELATSHALVDRVYELENNLPDTNDHAVITENDALTFTRERTLTASRFLARLYLTAWRDSEKIKLPFWLERDQ